MTAGPRGLLAVVLLLLGVICLGVFRIADGSETHAYNPDALAPNLVHLTQGVGYEISTRGGSTALVDDGVDVTTATCTWSSATVAATGLTVATVGADDRNTHVVGRFVSPVTGAVHVDCLGWGPVFVDDADDSGTDVSGLFLLLSVLALTAGAALGLSSLYAYGSARPAREEDQIEAGRPVGPDGEVRRRHGADVTLQGG